jgi:hypothetical protein
MCSCVPVTDCVCNGGCELGLQLLTNSTVGRYVKNVLINKSFFNIKQRHTEEEIIKFTFLIVQQLARSHYAQPVKLIRLSLVFLI